MTKMNFQFSIFPPPPRLRRTSNFQNRGFTLLETLIAVSIILVAIVVSFGIIPQGQFAVRHIKNQLTASYLAQEALEVVHNKRDNGMFFARDWLSDSELAACVPAGPDSPPVRCTINSLTNQLFLCSGPCPRLKVIEENGQILYGNGGNFEVNPFSEDTIFTRFVEISRIPNETAAAWEEEVYSNDGFDTGECADPNNLELEVRVKVSWDDFSRTREINLSEDLFYWGSKFIINCS